MPLREDELIKEGVKEAAELMVISGKTAPKAKGVDNIEMAVICDREELEKLASKMEEMADELGAFFKRDAMNIRNSDAVIIIGARNVDFKLKNPPDYKDIDLNKLMSIINLGIAIGSMAKMASIINVDNRIMYSAGLAAQRMKIVDADYVLAIPLSVKGKNIYFDRKF